MPKKTSKSPTPRKAVQTDAAPAAAAAAASQSLFSSLPKHVQIYLYVPNLIGYVRVALTVFAIYTLLNSARKPAGTDDAWPIGLLAYLFSFILDFFDGYAARLLGQSSDMGAVLDMVTDRVSTMLLLMVLGGVLYPKQFELYAGLAALDYSSHWVQMYAAKGHHKTSNADKNILVRAFYGIYPLFGYLCVGTEVFYMVQVVLFFTPQASLFSGTVPLKLASDYVLLPACVGKNLVNVAQLMSGLEAVAKHPR